MTLRTIGAQHAQYVQIMLNLSGGAAGWAYSPYFMELLEGVQNALALRHVPDVAPRQDWFAGNEGRRADKVRPAAHCIFLSHTLMSDVWQTICSPWHFAGS